MALRALQTRIRAAITLVRIVLARVELWLDSERDQLPLWLPVALGVGIAAWFVLNSVTGWTLFVMAALAVCAAGPVLGWHRRVGRVLGWAGMLAALGCGLVWLRAEWVAQPVLAKPVVTTITGLVERVEPRPALGTTRLTLATRDSPNVPPRVRVSLETLPDGVGEGAVISARVRLVPPPGAGVPGAYDFSRAAWFQGLGGTGKILGDVKVLNDADPEDKSLRRRLSQHVRSQIEGSAGGIASAFASGDRGGIAAEDEEAMRASGLTHLLSISGLHVTAVVAAAMVMLMRLLALSPRLALRSPVLAISAAGGAAVGIGYTLLTGAEVPTIRSCIAAVLVLIGISMGRDALTLRLVATGALVVLLLWPESLVGASFQLSFAAITSIVAFHDHPRVKAFLARRDEGQAKRLGRGLFGLLLTGLVVEVALAPIALFHFHKQGLYGALANMIAIPLTTFVIMPLEAIALTFDLVGWGAPIWWLVGKAIGSLLGLAHMVAAAPGAVATLSSLPAGAFALMLVGGFWLFLWKSRMRLLGLAPLLAGAIWTLVTPEPDLLVTGDGRHMAVRLDDGRLVLLRDRAGDYVRDMLAERAGEIEPLGALVDSGQARCSQDICITRIRRGGREWSIAATRSKQTLDWRALTEFCAKVDIFVSDRTLPRGCKPRWIKADAIMLRQTGGLAISLSQHPIIETVNTPGDQHPWRINAQLQPVVRLHSAAQYRRKSPASFP